MAPTQWELHVWPCWWPKKILVYISLIKWLTERGTTQLLLQHLISLKRPFRRKNTCVSMHLPGIAFISCIHILAIALEYACVWCWWQETIHLFKQVHNKPISSIRWSIFFSQFVLPASVLSCGAFPCYCFFVIFSFIFPGEGHNQSILNNTTVSE